MFDEMTTFASDMSSQTLVTDLVHELSSGLEIPFLLSSSSVYEKEAKYNELLFDKEKSDFKFGDIFYEKEENDLWLDQDLLVDSNSVKQEIESIADIDNFHSYFFKNDELKSYFKTDSSGHGSGSDSSSTELWTVTGERDASPLTPPEERISPDSILFIPNNEFKFIPIAAEEGNRKQALSNSTKTVRIQPKPNTATFDNIDHQILSNQTVMCNVFKDGRTTIMRGKGNCNDKVETIKNALISRKDSEIMQAKRKQERMIRNRESAYLSRKRKKEYVAHLEKQVQELLNLNNQLRQENQSLRESLAKYEDTERFSRGSKTKNIFTNTSRKTTTLLALMFTVCLNLGSFSFLNVSTVGPTGGNIVQTDGKIPFNMQNVRYSRSLLWTGPEIEDLNSLSNLSKTSCPINQTESIRLESELRRWIKGDEDFSRPLKRNTSKVGGYFFASDRTTKNSNKSKKKIRSRKMQSSSDVEVDVFGMKPHFFNFDTFFEAINRRDDTFYLVSFSADHLLLPALSHNKTSRPKMSLMLPAFPSNSTLGNSSDQVEMMQIDCEVTNTQLLSVNENDIPSHMRPYSNSTAKERKSNAGDRTDFPQILVELSEKKSSGENSNGSLRRGTRNMFSLKKADGKQVEELVDKFKGAKSNVFKFARFHDEVTFNQSIKEKENKLTKKTKNVGRGSYFIEEAERKSNSVNNGSNNVVGDGDGVQFLYPNGRNFLKTLMVPPAALEPAKNIEYSKKPHLKTFKNTMRFLFP